VPDSNIVFGGSGGNRNLVVIPAQNQIGTATITITVWDSGGLSASRSFKSIVTRCNACVLQLTSIATQMIDEDTTTGPLAFRIFTPETPAENLTLRASSSNEALVPSKNIVFGGANSDRTVQITPAPLQFGSLEITISVRDPNGRSASTTFTVTVLPVNNPPVISGYVKGRNGSRGSGRRATYGSIRPIIFLDLCKRRPLAGPGNEQ
jgi:hypothetical protein